MANLKNLKCQKNADGTITLTFDPTIVTGKSKGKAESDIVCSSGGFSDLDGLLPPGVKLNVCGIKK